MLNRSENVSSRGFARPAWSRTSLSSMRAEFIHEPPQGPPKVRNARLTYECMYTRSTAVSRAYFHPSPLSRCFADLLVRTKPVSLDLPQGLFHRRRFESL